jgi:hypothetical protein
MPITEILKKIRGGQKTRDRKGATIDQDTKGQFHSCTPCYSAIEDVTTNFKHLVSNIEATRNIRRDMSHSITLEDGITYTIDDINAKINRDKCWIEYHLERYRKCCKEEKLPEIEKFKC